MKSNINITSGVKVILLILIVLFSFNLITQAKTAPLKKNQPVFSESFDSFESIKANGGTYSDISLVEGKSGKGVLIQGKGSLVYPAKDHFNFQKGTIEFWVKPNWDGRYGLNAVKYILKVIWGNTQGLFIPVYISAANRIINYLYPTFYGSGVASETRVLSIEPYTVMQWKPGEWHKVMLFWDFTIPDDQKGRHQSYLVGKVDGNYTRFQRVAPVIAEPIAANAKIMIGYDTVPGRTPADAVIDELKIYATSLLPVVPFPEYQFNPFYPETEAAFRKLFENDGFCSNFETYNTQPADCSKLSEGIRPGDNVLFFQRPAFEQIYENYVPKEMEISNKFHYQATKGEYDTIFFNVYSRIDLNKVNVNYTDFQGDNGTIPKTNLDLRVVKNWFQAARGMATPADQLPSYVPALLLHNDQIPLETDQTLSNVKVPSLPILDHVKTKISKYTSRQFAMIVKIPEGAAAGSYISTVTLTAAGMPAQKLTLNLEVLPFTLRNTGKVYSLWHGLDSDKNYAAKMRIDPFEILRKDLIDIKNHGFNSIIFYSYNDASYYKPLSALEVQTKKIKIAQQTGFKRVVIYTGVRPATRMQEITPACKDMMVRHGFEPWFYGVDEFGFGRSMEEQIYKSGTIHRIGGKVAATTLKESSDALDDQNSPVYGTFPAGTYEPLDWVIYPFWTKYPFDLMAGKAQKNPKKIETCYWQGRDPQANRYLCGYFLWVTGLDGASIHVYRGAGSKGQFYNDFEWTGPDRRVRPYILSDPSLEGPVPTMQWEAAREGIKDGKYLATWKYYKDKAAQKNPALAQQSEEVVNDILEHYRDSNVTVNPAFYRIAMAQYEADRKTIIEEIMKLMAAKGKPETPDINAPTGSK